MTLLQGPKARLSLNPPATNTSDMAKKAIASANSRNHRFRTRTMWKVTGEICGTENILRVTAPNKDRAMTAARERGMLRIAECVQMTSKR
jgi:hypothetical protein